MNETRLKIQQAQPLISINYVFVVQQSQGSVDKEAPPSTDTAGAMWNAVTNLTKQRVRLNMKLLGQFGSQSGTPPMKEDRPTYREQFVPPEMSMVSYFLIKVIILHFSLDLT
jgi:DmX-like protein